MILMFGMYYTISHLESSAGVIMSQLEIREAYPHISCLVFNLIYF